MSETDTMRRIQIAASIVGARLFRNTTGFCTCRSIPIKYGIPSTGGGSDLLGWTSRNGIPVFTAIEVKSARGKATPEQENFIAAVRRANGIAAVVRTAEEALTFLR